MMKTNLDNLIDARQKIIFCIALIAALLHLYYPLFGIWKESRVLHLMMFMVVVFLMKPLRSEVPWLNIFYRAVDFILISGTLAFSIYPLLDFNAFIQRAEALTEMDVLIGGMATLIVLEGVRRAAGLPMLILAVVFIVYAYFGPMMPEIIAHRGAAVEDIINIVYVAPEGIYGLPVAVMTTYVFLFIVFGAILEASGGASHIINVANALVGRSRGGPAKIAVIASGMMGSISGSSVANVATTGAVTIPMMKRIGMKPHVAAGIEAVASTGGMIMPPVMGAVAFIMSEMVGIPYVKIIVLATIPAFLYYYALYIVVHLEACKLPPNVGENPDEYLTVGESLKRAWWVVIPIVILVAMLVAQYSAPLSVVAATLLLIGIILVKDGVREGSCKIIEAFNSAVRASAPLTVLCAAAGIVISMVYLTGIGVRFSSIVLELSQGNSIIVMLLVAIVCIVLGMGLPVTAAYLTTVAIAGSVMLDIGFSPAVSHLFIIFYAVLSGITPPFCMVTFTAAGIAESHLWKTGWYAFKYGFTGYLVPFLFILTPPLLILESDLSSILYATGTNMLGLAAAAATVVGYLNRHLASWERIVFAIGAGLLFFYDVYLNAAGAIICAGMYFLTIRNDQSAIQQETIIKKEATK